MQETHKGSLCTAGPLTVVNFTNICGAKNRGAFAQNFFDDSVATAFDTAFSAKAVT